MSLPASRCLLRGPPPLSCLFLASQSSGLRTAEPLLARGKLSRHLCFQQRLNPPCRSPSDGCPSRSPSPLHSVPDPWPLGCLISPHTASPTPPLLPRPNRLDDGGLLVSRFVRLSRTSSRSLFVLCPSVFRFAPRSPCDLAHLHCLHCEAGFCRPSRAGCESFPHFSPLSHPPSSPDPL